MEAIILAGGFGTRLAGTVKDVPKPMAPVCGRPFLEYIFDWLTEQGTERIILAVGYKKDCIIKHFGYEYRGASIAYSVEDTPLYTGGAAKKAMSLCREERVFIVNGDTYFPVNLKRLRTYATDLDVSAVAAVKRMHDFDRYGTVMFDEAYRITDIREKRPCRSGYINGGIYDFAVETLNGYPDAFSMENDCFPKLISTGNLVAFPDDESFIDIGIPEDYAMAQNIFKRLRT